MLHLCLDANEMLEPPINIAFRTFRGTVRVSGGMELAQLFVLKILNFGVGALDVPRSFGLLDSALARRISIRMSLRELLRFMSPDTLRVSSQFIMGRKGVWDANLVKWRRIPQVVVAPSVSRTPGDIRHSFQYHIVDERQRLF